MINNQTFIREITARTGYTIKDVSAVLEVMETIAEEMLKGGEDIKILKNVTLKPVSKPAREARNPRTGEMVMVPAKNSVKATFTKTFKEAIQ